MALFQRKKKTNFFHLLQSQMEAAREGTAALYEYCATKDDALGDKVVAWEKEGDNRRRILIEEINRTYLTPFDREDLFDLSRMIDDVLDYAAATVDELRLYNIPANEEVCLLVENLLLMSECLLASISGMENRREVAKEEALKAKKLENVIGRQCREYMAKLFEEDDFKSIFKYREVYRHLNRSSDIGDAVADLIMNIMVQL